MKVSVSHDVEIPEATLIYDIGREAFVCGLCGGSEAFKLLNRQVTRGAEPSVEKATADFVAKHTPCVLRKPKPEPYERGGPGDR